MNLGMLGSSDQELSVDLVWKRKGKSGFVDALFCGIGTTCTMGVFICHGGV